MTYRMVTTAERPDLARITGTWRWEAFFKDDEHTSLADILELDDDCASSHDLIPTVLVLLEHEQPIGMVALCLDDLADRPELNPWLAGLYVIPTHRGHGYGTRLIHHLEALAQASQIPRLSLYTAEATTGLYIQAGWTIIETFDEEGKIYSIMQKQLVP